MEGKPKAVVDFYRIIKLYRKYLKRMVVDGIEVEVIKKKIKNMRLSVSAPHGKVRISAPKNLSEDTIRQFVTSKILWVHKQIERFENRPQQAELKYVSGEGHYLWGQKYPLTVIYSNCVSRAELTEEELILTVKEKSTVSQREKVLNQWYREQLKEVIPKLFIKWEREIGVKASEFRIKNMKTRWGTCNPKAKRIWLNLQLIKRPPHCLEYVVVHELCHLLERNHNSVFKGYLKKYLPNWTETRKELNSPAIN